MRKISVIDCETDPFLYNREPEPFIWGYYDGKTYFDFDSTKDLIYYLSEKNEIVYAHNGGKFDFHYLIDGIDKFRRMRVINDRLVSVRMGKCELRDSYAIIPTALKSFKKDEFDYAKLEKRIRRKYMEEIRAYLKSDCVNLYQLVKAFINQYGLRLTTASAAMHEWKRISGMKGEELSSGPLFYSLFYKYYFGGRVSTFFRGEVKHETRTYDINSAYPFAMLHDHPIGEEITLDKGNINDIRGDDFYDIQCQSFGALPQRDNNLSFPVTKSIRTYFTTGWELLAGIRTNTIRRCNILRRFRFHRHINFSKYVDIYYAQKQNSEKHSTQYIFAKLMLNALYGKFAANPANYRDYMIIPAELLGKAEAIDGYKYCGILGRGCVIVSKPIEFKFRHYYNIATAASITGFVRAYLWRAICKLREKGSGVYYCDTDSLITDGILPTSNNLGDWKLESNNSRAIIISPKLYGTYSSKGGWKIASKGIEIDYRGLLTLANGHSYTYRRNAPTYSLSGKYFIERNIAGLEITDDYAS